MFKKVLRRLTKGFLAITLCRASDRDTLLQMGTALLLYYSLLRYRSLAKVVL
jgi:hypothetical protein